MSTKGRKRQKKISVVDIYCNNNFVPPKEQNLETIFEEPRQSKDGVPILTSVKKYKRYLHFDPTQNKIQKRKRKAKKCVKKLKNANRITRSSPKDSECDEMALYLDVLNDSSSGSDTDIIDNTYSNVTIRSDTPSIKHNLSQKTLSSDPDRKSSCSDVFDTPKKNRSGLCRISSSISQNICSLEDELVNQDSKIEPDAFVEDMTESTIESEENISVSSPRSSCEVS